MILSQHQCYGAIMEEWHKGFLHVHMLAALQEVHLLQELVGLSVNTVLKFALSVNTVLQFALSVNTVL
jgi:hypothetical protein